MPGGADDRQVTSPRPSSCLRPELGPIAAVPHTPGRMDERLLTAFAFGLGVGLLSTVWTWAKAWLQKRELRAEVQRLRDHVHSHIELSHEGVHRKKEELERLRLENENLRVTVKAWQQKPDRRELRTLHVYDHAARQLMKSAPGFASHWEAALQEAEVRIAQEDQGVLAFARRLVLPRTRTGPEAPSPSAESAPAEGAPAKDDDRAD